MIDTQDGSPSGHRDTQPWRRAMDVLDDYDRGGALTEALADDLVNELAGLGPRARTALVHRAPHRPAPAPAPITVTARPRLTLVRGGA